MKIIVLLVLGILTVGFWLAVDQNSDLGKNPGDEEVISGHELNAVTGEVLKTELVRCKICGQTLSFSKFNYLRKCVYAHHHMHTCSGPIVRSAIDAETGIYAWLERWQRRLRFKR